jgi:hypothetical protein
MDIRADGLIDNAASSGQSLVEICSRNGLLGRLSALNFPKLAKEDSRLSSLTNQTTCMGNVYAATRSLPVWKNILKHSGV